MPTNFGPYSIDENTSERGGSLLRTAIGLSPLALGAYGAFQGVGAVGGLSSPFKSGSPIRGLGEGIGAAALKSKRDHVGRAQAAAESIAKSLQDTSIFSKMEQTVENYTALLHTLSTALEDPEFAVDSGQMQKLKNDIVDQMSNLSDLGAARDLSEKVVRAIMDSGDVQSMGKLNQYLGEYSRLSGQIEAPHFDISKSGVSYNAIDISGIKNKAVARRAERVMDALGSNYNVQLQEYTEFGHTNIVAQVYTSKGRWKSNIPLGSSASGASMYFRSGESFNTLYAAPRQYLDAGRAWRESQRVGMKAFTDAGFNSLPFSQYEDYVVGMLEQRSKQGGWLDFSAFNAEMTRPMMIVDRNATGFSTGQAFNPILSQMGGHIQRQVGYKMNVAHVGNVQSIPAQHRQMFMAQLANIPGADPGITDRILSGHGAGAFGTLGRYAGSPMQILSSRYGMQGFEFTRADIPVTMREQQLIGRTSMFGGTGRAVGRGGYIGPVATTGQSLVPELMSGGLNKAMVVDFSESGAINRSLQGSGMAITGMKHETFKPMSFNILNPSTHKHGQTKLLTRLMQAEANGGYVTVSAQELREGVMLGMSSGKQKWLPADPRATAMHLQIDRTAQASGKDMIYVKAIMERNTDHFKLFGMTFKGNIETRGAKQIESVLGGGLAGDLSQLGIDPMEAAYAAGDFFKKGRGAFVHQISASAQLFGGVGVDDIKKFIPSLPKTGQRIGGGLIGNYAAAATVALSKKGVGGRQIGMMLAGVYHAGEKHGVKRDELVNFVQRTLRAKDSEEAVKAMKRGISIFVDTYQQGESSGDWLRGRAGVESRFAKSLWERLSLMGMSADSASEVVSEVYRNKINFSEHFEIAKNLLNMTNSIHGGRGVTDLLSERSITQINYKDLLGRIGSDRSLVDLLRSDEFAEGMLVDFSGAPSEFAHGMRKHFKQGQVYLPGREMFMLSRGTDIKQAGGQSIGVEGAYGKLINAFQGRLLAAHGAPGSAGSEFGAWVQNANELFADVTTQLTSGKLKGSASPRASMYDLNNKTFMTGRAHNLALSLFEKTHGTSVFLSTEGFLSQLADSRLSQSEVAEKMKYFFTSLEGQHLGTIADQARGIYGVSGRHPIMTTGNVFVTQTFRSLEEVGHLGGVDEFFTRVANAPFMKSFGGVNSFADVAGMSDKRQGQFFESLAANLKSFTGGQGGGILKVPRLLGTQNLPGVGNVEVDLGMGAQAFLDQDGDTVLHMLLSNSRAKMMEGLISKGRPADAYFRTFANRVGAYAKEGMGRYGATMGIPVDAVVQDTLKEIGLAQSTGQLDTALRPLHDAILAYGPGGVKQVEMRGMLGILQEHVILKAKKLDKLTPLATELQDAARYLTETGDASRLRRVVGQNIFGGTEYAAGATINASPVSVSGSARAQQIAADMTAGTDVGSTLEDIFTGWETAAQKQLKYGPADPTSKQLQALMQRDPVAALQQLVNGDGLLGSTVRGYRQSRMKDAAGTVSMSLGRIKDSMARLDSRAALPLAAGLVGSTLAMGILGDQGYSPDPIVGVGENVGPRVTQGIAQGNLFSYGQVGPSPDQMAHREANYAMMDRPINVGATYMTRPNGYQIRGETYSDSGLSTVTSYLNRLGARGGSLVINDQRRPITSSYVDRLMGEY